MKDWNLPTASLKHDKMAPELAGRVAEELSFRTSGWGHQPSHDRPSVRPASWYAKSEKPRLAALALGENATVSASRRTMIRGGVADEY